MFKKFLLTTTLAVALAVGSFFALAPGGRSAEAACPPGDTGCNQANSLSADITRASNASSVFFFGPGFISSPFFPTPVFTAPVAPVFTGGFASPFFFPQQFFFQQQPLFFQSPFFFGSPFGSCVRTGDVGFCPNFFAFQFSNATGFFPFFP